MLVIVNPYATTVSDRLRNLVVYALQGRYEVEAVDTQAATTPPSCAARPRTRATTSSSPSAATARSTRRPTASPARTTPLTLPARRRDERLCKMLGIPGDIVDATEHLLRLADDWRPRRIDLARVNGRHFTFTAGLGPRRRRRQARRRAPEPQEPHAAPGTSPTPRSRRSPRDYWLNPPRLEVRTPDGGAQPRASRRSSRTATRSPTSTTARSWSPRARCWTTGDARRRSCCERATPLDVPSIAVPRARQAPAPARPPPHQRLLAASPSSPRARSTGARVPLQVDGDYIGDVTEATYGITPRALSVVA